MPIKSLMHLNYETTGLHTGLPLLMVHGFLSSNAQWIPNVDALGAAHRLIMVELWGHGDSPSPDEYAYTLSRYDEEFEAIRDTLGIERWGVIGQSYAAGLALRYALNHPDRTAGVVVTNSRSAFGDITGDDRSPRGGPRSNAADVTGNRHLPIHPVHARRLPPDIRRRLIEAADRVSRVAIERGGRLAMTLNAMHLLDHVQAPVLLTNGVFEKSFQPSADTIRRAPNGVDVVDLDGGHAVNIDAADAFNQAVLSFFHVHNR